MQPVSDPSSVAPAVEVLQGLALSEQQKVQKPESKNTSKNKNWNYSDIKQDQSVSTWLFLIIHMYLLPFTRPPESSKYENETTIFKVFCLLGKKIKQ